MKISNTRPILAKASCLTWLFSSVVTPLTAAVTPGGTFTDKATISEAGGGETLARATTAAGLGPVLVHDFDGGTVDPTYELVSPSQVALSSGRHLVIYSTRFDANAGLNRAEILTNLSLAPSAVDPSVSLAAGQSQGFIRRTGGADETVISGGAIIDVATDDSVLTLESRRSDNNPNTGVLPTRVGGFTSGQLLKLDDNWDYLSVERSVNGGSVTVAASDVTYDTNNSVGTMGTAFSFSVTSGDVTLNETGLYLVFANTGIANVAANQRTMYQQFLTLGGTEVAGSKTTTYVRGNANSENARDGVASLGMIVSATAGQVLNVEIQKESGGADGTVQGGRTALTIVKLPLTAKYIELTDTTNQVVTDASVDVVGFDTISSPANSIFTHSGGSTVTVNAADDYLFLGSLFTESDAANDNHDRIIPIHGWQIDGAGGAIAQGHGAQYNRDNGNNRTSGSWNATLLSLTSGQTVEMTSQNLGTAPNTGLLTNRPGLQGLSVSSLIVNNDPAISTNLPITVLPLSVGNIISNAFLDTFDNDTPATGLTYTVDTAPTGGTLLLSGGAIGIGGTFTQEDIDNGDVTFDAGGVAPLVGGFDFTVSDGSASDSSSFVINVEWPTTTVTIVDDGDVTEGGVSDFIFTADVAPVGANLTVTIAYSGSATSGSDFTGVTTVDILDGTTTGTLNVTTLADGLFEGAESITATIIDVSGATITGAIGTPSSATFFVEDGSNSAPTGTNLTQVISGVGTIDIADIIVSDGDTDYDSSVTTATEPLFHTNGIANVTVFSDGRADDDSSFDVDAGGPALDANAGFSLELAFTPQAGDLVGVVDVWEIGGSSNGSAILLIDGIPHLLSKANGGAGDVPTDTGDPGFVDTDWATGNQVVVPLSGVALTAGVPARIAVIFDILGNTVEHSVNGAAATVTNLTPQSGNNWRGDHTVNTGTGAGTGTGGSNNGTGIAGTTAPAVIKNLVNGFGSHNKVRFWNESSGSVSNTAGSPDTVTATLTIAGWVAGAGDLTATSGNGETYGAGVWMVTGTSDVVNAALAAVQFVTDAGTVDPTTINISIEDGDEDGGGPTTGVILYTPIAPDPIYVDDSFPGSIGDPIVDGDLGDPGAQGATFGLNAFTTLTEALGAVTPTGTIIVNDGDYSTENIVLADMVTLQLTDTAGPVQIGDIVAGLTNSIDLQGNTLELGATNLTASAIAAPISGVGGNLTKVGTGRVTIHAPTSHTGTTTVLDGFLRLGQNVGLDPSLQSELGGDGPVVVTAPGRLEFVVAVDRTINQTGAISGTGSLATFSDGTLVFDGPGANTFSGGMDLGDGAVSSFNGIDGAKQGFVVVNHNDHLGSGAIRSRGGQLQAGTPSLVIPNDINITGGGFRNGGSIDYELAGTITTIDNDPRGFGNYGLEGCDLTISGNITSTTATGTINFEASNGKDNGSWTVTGDISGPQSVLVTGSFTNGEVTFAGNHTHAGTTNFDRGTIIFNATQTGGGNFNVNNDAILTGTGSTTSPVTIAGSATLSPGASPGTFTTGDLTINGTLQIDAENNTPGTGHDQVIANGTVSLGGASALVVDAGGGLTPGELVIISNDAADGVSGTFSGLAEGGALETAVSGIDATVTYTGGDADANDVAITFVGYTTQGQWRVNYYGDPTDSGAGANGAPASNALNNLQSFALDLDPTTAAPGLVVDTGAGTITTLGPPVIWYDPTDGKAYLRHTRRTDFASIPLTITDQFSRDLTAFENSAVVPSVIATGTGDSGAAIEAVQTELPLILPVNGGKARYGRIDVTSP